jgi:hypothetical protein
MIASRQSMLVVVILTLAGCDQSINEMRASGTELTGKYCEAKDAPEQSCQAGDIVTTVEGRERLLCDWSWQIVHEPGSNEVLCVYNGQLRESR